MKRQATEWERNIYQIVIQQGANIQKYIKNSRNVKPKEQIIQSINE
jgi:hypothetical protein